MKTAKDRLIELTFKKKLTMLPKRLQQKNYHHIKSCNCDTKNELLFKGT